VKIPHSKSMPKRDALSLAHALRTPLTALSLAADMLEDERHGPLTRTQRELARTVAREAGRLRLVLEGALRTDRLGAHAGPVDRVPLELGPVVAEALRPFHEQARAREITIVLRLGREVWVVGDRPKLAWVAASLVGNALRFAPPGTRVEVRVSTSGERVDLRVRDKGPGIPAPRRRAVFAREGGGTLFLIQEVVEAHGGTIRVAPVGSGTAFVVSMPRAARPDAGDFA
jgi:signal transduction histidine kinase